MVLRQTRLAKWCVGLLGFLLVTNVLLYQPSVQRVLSFQLERGVVVGSLIDLVIVAPILTYAAFKLSKKQMVGLMVVGLVLARFLIPEELFAPFTVMLYAGIAFEGLFVLAELAVVLYIIRKIPQIKAEMNAMEVGTIFTMLPAIEKHSKSQLLIRVISSEILMFYYAFFTWKKKEVKHRGTVTMHKNTSAIALNIMIIHAIVIETIGIHWWLHSKMPILSIILLLLNVYSIILFIANIQITRLHPLEVKNGRIYVTQGLMQRVILDIHLIEKIVWGAEPSKEAMTFKLADFEEVPPQVVLYLKEPVEATLYMGKKKRVRELAFRVDEPEKLKALLAEAIEIKEEGK